MTKHHKCFTTLYRVWTDMRQRCSDPRRKEYYGRGIKICEEWNEFSAFEEWAVQKGYQKGLWIDRKNNDEGYNPENCHWVTPEESANNTRRNRHIEAWGEIKTISQWVRDARCKVTKTGIRSRLETGISPELAISLPSSPGKRNDLYKPS